MKHDRLTPRPTAHATVAGSEWCRGGSGTRIKGTGLRALCVLAATLAFPASGQSPSAVAQLAGADFSGGAKDLFGASFYARDRVNYVYAQPSGPAATMTARFQLATAPSETQFLSLDAMDDDAAAQCRIRISLNGQEIFEGLSGFPDAFWLCGQYRISPGVLRAGTNLLVLSNLEQTGSAGMPPWFMLARAAIGNATYRLPPLATGTSYYQVTVPSDQRAFPEPLPAGRTQPGFAFRGTKGWNWNPGQYLAEAPFLAAVKMNFMMNCYLSLFSSRPPNGWGNQWWNPLPEATKSDYAQVIQACQTQGVSFCFAMNPQLYSSRPLVETNLSDIDALYQHYAWAQSQGVQWFSICLDDVSWIGRGAHHAFLVNTIFDRLRHNDPAAQMIFCPGPYWGNGTGSTERVYLQALADQLHPDVYVFWTGDGVIGQQISYAAAQSYRSVVQHRVFLWENYPVNDLSPTLHLGPISGRDTNLCEIIDGYMSNPMCPQNEINRLPLATCADYSYNPWAYDPARSIGQAILLLAGSGAQRDVLKDLTEAYPGFLVVGGGTGANPVRNIFASLEYAAAQEFKDHLQDILTRLAGHFPDRFADARQTVANDIGWMGGVGGPRLISTASVDGRQITLLFTNGVDRASATNPANFRLVGGSVLSGQLLPAPDTNVLVLTTTGLNEPAFFALTGNGVKDSQGICGLIEATGPIQGFTVQNIGIVRDPGAVDATWAPGYWLIYSRGDDIFGSSDGFNFVYRTASGDFDAMLRIRQIGPKNQWTRGGLMARENVSPGSRNLMVGTYPAGTGLWVTSWRSSSNGTTSAVLASRTDDFPTNAWVRLKRVGSAFLSYYSIVGCASTEWSLLASNHLDLPEGLLLGMASSAIDVSGGDSSPARFQYSDLSHYAPVGPPLWITLNGAEALIRWPTNAASGCSLQESSQLGPGANWSPTESVPVLSGNGWQVTFPLRSNAMYFKLMR